jgi:hypothetical protein
MNVPFYRSSQKYATKYLSEIALVERPGASCQRPRLLLQPLQRRSHLNVGFYRAPAKYPKVQAKITSMRISKCMRIYRCPDSLRRHRDTKECLNLTATRGAIQVS